MPVAHYKYLKIWTHDAGHARRFFGFPDDRPVHVLKDAPETPDEKQDFVAGTKLFAVLAHEPHDGYSGTLTTAELAELLKAKVEPTQEQLRRLNGTLPEDEWDME